MNWKPIETAPKDGTAVIGLEICACQMRFIERCWFLDGFVDEGGMRLANPTHWMPLPEPPA